jgi:5'-phosphate synthase pdxT subunit
MKNSNIEAGKNINIGILALQGAFQKHQELLRKIHIRSKQVRCIDDLSDCDGLIIPGGESTTMSKLLRVNDFFKALVDFSSTHPVMGTCAGAILMAKKNGDEKVPTLGLIDIEIERNAYGSQVDSFREQIKIDATPEKTFDAYFIRAPKIIHTGKEVEILASYKGTPVIVRQGKYLAMTFHPELTEDARVHEYFIGIINK